MTLQGGFSEAIQLTGCVQRRLRTPRIPFGALPGPVNGYSITTTSCLRSSGGDLCTGSVLRDTGMSVLEIKKIVYDA